MSIVVVVVAVVFSILVKTVDVAPIGIDGTSVGFASLNLAFLQFTGVHPALRVLTDILGAVLLLVALVYAVIGFAQLLRYRSLRRVDPAILALGVFYIVVIAVYFLFEQLAINYRPDALEASYPSSHTLLAVCICASAMIVNRRLAVAHGKRPSNVARPATRASEAASEPADFVAKSSVSAGDSARPADTRATAPALKAINICLFILAVVVVLGRAFSGVHWLSDIVGGVIIAAALVSLFHTAILLIDERAN